MGYAAHRHRQCFFAHKMDCAETSGDCGMSVLEILGHILSRLRRNKVCDCACARGFSAVSLVSPSDNVRGIDVCMVYAQPYFGEAACPADKRDEVRGVDYVWNAGCSGIEFHTEKCAEVWFWNPHVKSYVFMKVF